MSKNALYPTEHCLLLAAVARSAEVVKDLPRRNSVCIESFKIKSYRDFTLANKTVETWFSSSAGRIWITSLTPERLAEQVGYEEAPTAGNVETAAYNHFSAIADVFLGRCPDLGQERPLYGIRHRSDRSLSAGCMAPQVILQFLRAVTSPWDFHVFHACYQEAMNGMEWMQDNTNLVRK